MPIIQIEKHINSPPATVFDLAINVDVHTKSTASTKERAVAGVTSGPMKLGETVTWEAKQLGFWFKLTSQIVAYDRPWHFIDQMVSGPFRSMIHHHDFKEVDGGTLMIDKMEYAAPLGILGRIAELLFLNAHLKHFFEVR